MRACASAFIASANRRILSTQQARHLLPSHFVSASSYSAGSSVSASSQIQRLKLLVGSLFSTTTAVAASSASTPPTPTPSAPISTTATTTMASADSKADSSSAAKKFVSRTVKQTVLSVEQGEGMGARVRRSIGRPELRNFDPFLMLDEFRVGPPAGFPDHPHRGFETVTYMLPSTKGSFQHEDFAGHKGIIGPGDLQWMTAGRGIVHSEMPASQEESHGLQLWVNLSSKDKLVEPAYQELKANQIPHVTKDGVTAIVIAGEALGVKSPVYTRTPVYYLHFFMEKNSVLHQDLPDGWASFAYTIEGKAFFGDVDPSKGKAIDAHHTVVFDKNGSGVTVRTGDDKVEFVIVSGKPINEPIVQYGPFVMNSQKEIQQAFADYQSGKNGFERAPAWHSEIGRHLDDD